jgi:hypothetical protein
MSVDQTEVVDFVHLDPKSDEVLLSISDQLGWDEDEGEHLLLLQEKLNTYLGYVEGGQLTSDFPHLKGKPIVIRVFGTYPLSERALRFFDLAKGKIEEAGCKLRFELFRKEQD